MPGIRKAEQTVTRKAVIGRLLVVSHIRKLSQRLGIAAAIDLFLRMQASNALPASIAAAAIVARAQRRGKANISKRTLYRWLAAEANGGPAALVPKAALPKRIGSGRPVHPLPLSAPTRRKGHSETESKRCAHKALNGNGAAVRPRPAFGPYDGERPLGTADTIEG